MRQNTNFRIIQSRCSWPWGYCGTRNVHAQSTSFGLSLCPPIKSNYTPVLGPSQSWQSVQTSLDVCRTFRRNVGVRLGVGFSSHQLNFANDYPINFIRYRGFVVNPEIQLPDLFRKSNKWELRFLVGSRLPVLSDTDVKYNWAFIPDNNDQEFKVVEAYFGFEFSLFIANSLRLDVIPLFLNSCLATLNEDAISNDYSTLQKNWGTFRINYVIPHISNGKE